MKVDNQSGNRLVPGRTDPDLWGLRNQSGNRDMNNPLYPPFLRGNSVVFPLIRGNPSGVAFDKGNPAATSYPNIL